MRVMGPYVFVNALLIGFFAFAALHYFWHWWLSRRDRVFIVFALLCGACGLYSLSMIAIVTARTVAACQQGTDARVTIGLLLQPLVAGVFSFVTGVRARYFLVAVSVVCVPAGILNLFAPLTVTVTGLELIRAPWGEELVYPQRGPAGWWAWPLHAVVAAVQLFGLVAATRLWPRDRPASTLIALAALGSLAAQVFGALIDLSRVRLPYSGLGGYAIFVVLISLLLSRVYARRGEQIAASEHRCRTLVEQASDGIVICDPRGRCLDVNPAGSQMLGYRPDQLLRLSLGDLISPEDAPRLGPEIARLLGGAPAKSEWRFRRGDGALFWGEIHVRQLPDGRLLGFIRDVSERKRTEERLRTSEALYRTMIEAAPEAIVVMDLERGAFVDFNRKACDLFGASAEELLALGPVDLSPPVQPDGRSSEAAVRELHRAAGAGNELIFEWMHRARDGRDIPCEVRLVRLPDPARVLIRGSVIDISERKRAEAALRRSEERYRLIVKNQTEFIVKWLPDGTRTFVNESYCRYFGVREEDCLGTSFVPMVAPEYREAIRRKLAGLTPAAPEATDEHLSFVAGGALRWQQWNDVGVFDAGGRLVELLSTGRDITERKQAEQALAAQEMLLRQFIKHSPAAIAMFDRDMRYIQTSDRWLIDFNLTGRDVIGRSHYEVFPGIPDRWKAIHQRVLAGAVERCDEDPLRRADGTTEWLQWECRPWLAASQDVGGLIMFAQVITERKRAEEKLQSYHERLKALSQQVLHTQETERRRLARDLHDEIGQILTAIGLRLHQLKARCGPDLHPVLDDDMAVVNRAIEQVREMSLNLRPPMLDVLGLEAALRWYADNQRHRTGLEVELVGHLDTEHFDPNLEIACFRVVQEALTNVLRHARATRAWIELVQDEDALHVTVRDDGVGFDVAAAQGRAGRGRSFGVLSMQERVELLNGRLAIDSAPGRGTRISARFPLPSTERVGTRP